MGIPKQVMEAGKKADDALSTLETGNTDPAPEPTDKDPEASPKPDDENSETWKHKFDVLKGKYDKEVGKGNKALEDENRQLKDQISRLTLQVSDLTTVNGDLAKKLEKPEKPEAPQPVLTEEDIAYLEKEDLGGKTLELIQRLIDSRVAENTKPLKERVDSTEKAVTEQTGQQKAAAFGDNVRAGILKETKLDYDTINNAPEFSDYLSNVVPYTGGMTRRMIGEKAHKEGDVATFVQLYADFVAETGFGKKPEPKKEDPLEAEIEPSTTDDTATVPDFQPGKVYTASDIKKVYDDFAKGKYRGREAEYQKIDADILKAHSEPGRPRIQP